MERRMRSLAGRLGAIALALGLTASSFAPRTAFGEGDAAGAKPDVRGEVVASLPVGTGEGEVGVERGPEETWGVSAFAIGPDGAFYVVDGVNDKIVVVNANGVRNRDIPLPPPLLGPEDIAVTEDGVYLMDVAVQPCVVCRLDDTGGIQRTWTIPDDYAAHAVTGMTVQPADASGYPRNAGGSSGEDIFIEIDDSWQVPLVENGVMASLRPLPLVRLGNTADVPAADAADFGLRTGRPGGSYSTWIDPVGRCSGTVTFTEGAGRRARLAVRGKGEIGRLKPIDRDASGRHYVVSDEMGPDGSVLSSAVRVFEPHGAEVALVPLPASRFATVPNRPLRVTGDGRVLCMVPGEQVVTIERLRELPSEHPEDVDTASARGAAHAGGDLASRLSGLSRLWDLLREALSPKRAHAIWTRINASDRAAEYLGLSWYCSKANYDRSCGDYRPAFLTAYGKSYTSVPYCWGGFDTASSFKSLMSSGRDAGDVNTSGGKRWCTAGVDCSGFVSRVWGLGTKYSTSTLPNVSYRIARTSMKVGDIYNYAGKHAIVFRYFTSTGSSAVWESTMTSDKDRVVAWTRTATALSSYDTRRYYNW